MKASNNSIFGKIGASYAISSVSIILVLVLLGFFSLLIFNVNEMSISAKENISITLVIKPKVSNSDIEFFQKKLALQPYCKTATIITPKEAWDMVTEDLGLDLKEVLDTNPLPYTIVINPVNSYASADSIEKIAKKFKNIKIVEDVFYNENLVSQIDRNISKIALIFVILEAILLVMAFALINNTVRLNIHSKQNEINTMQLVGASNSFIMKPFLINAFILGFVSSIVSIAVIIAAILSYQNASDDIVKISYLLQSFMVVLVAGIFVTLFSTFLAVKKYLKNELEIN